jgi:hypothetical protein
MFWFLIDGSMGGAERRIRGNEISARFAPPKLQRAVVKKKVGYVAR